MSKNKINIAIIGATGFTGLDLVFLLSKHPKAKIINLCATKNLGKKISFFDKRIKKNLPKISSVNKINWKIIDLAFLSLPNGQAQKLINEVYYNYKKVKFIDLSADFRIKNPKIYKENYKQKHKSLNLQKKAIYAISELVKKDIRNYRIIANPGCYPTSIQIPLIPLLKKKLISNKNIIVDSKSGYSGAGKNLEKKFTHKNLYQSVYAYSTKQHRHMAEIDQEFKKHIKKDVKFIFNPHIIPTFRGILTSIYVQSEKKSSPAKIRDELIRFYKNHKFIKILQLDSNIGSGNVLNTNKCEISICKSIYKDKLLIISAIDNLVKGASGQAIQNMNLLYSFPEHLGIK